MIFGHVTLVDEPGEPLKIRAWMPGKECQDFPLDTSSFFLLAEQVLKAWLRRVRAKLI